MGTDKQALSSGAPYNIGDRDLYTKAGVMAKAGLNPAYVTYFEDFLLASGGTLPVPLVTAKTGASSAAGAYVNDASAGHYSLTTTADNEAQTNRVDFSDQLVFDITRLQEVECRLKITCDATGTSGFLGSGDVLLFGVASAYNATLDSVTTHAWLKVIGDGADAPEILWETDDGTTDDDDNDSGAVLAEATWLHFKIVFEQGADIVTFLIDTSGGSLPDWRNARKVSGAMAAATGNVQPIVYLSKAAAANNDHTLLIDYIRAVYSR
jgi:hypothetical protein